jgi:predicted dehydrogenase
VQAAAQRGVAVLCEKPLTDRLSNARKLPRDARIMCAFKFRFLSGAARLRQMIAEGELGRIVSIRGTAISNLDMSQTWFARPELSGGGVLLDNGVHLVDLCRFLLGDVEAALGVTTPSTRGLKVEETGAALLRMANGTTVHLLTSWETPAPMPPLIEIHGSRACARLGNETEVFDAAGKERRLHISGEGVDIWRAVIANFVAYLKGEAAPHATLADGFAAQAAIEAAYRSMTSGRWERPETLS